MKKVLFALLFFSVFFSENLYSQREQGVPTSSLGNWIRYNDAFMFNYSANNYTPNEENVKDYARTFDRENYSKIDEFSRAEYLKKMEEVFLDKIKNVNYDKEFMFIFNARLSEYNFEDKSFTVEYEIGSEDLTDNSISRIKNTNILRNYIDQNIRNQKLFVDNFNCFNIEKIYLNQDEAKKVVATISQHTLGARPISAIGFFKICNKKTGNQNDLTAHIDRISFFERKLMGYNIYMPAIQTLYPNCPVQNGK